MVVFQGAVMLYGSTGSSSNYFVELGTNNLQVLQRGNYRFAENAGSDGKL